MGPAQPMSQSVHRQWRSHCMGHVMDKYFAGMDMSVTCKQQISPSTMIML